MNTTGNDVIRDAVVIDDTTAIAVGSGIVLITKSRGRSWSEIPGSYPSGSWYAVDYNPATNVLVAFGRLSEQTFTAMRSTDGGLSWETISGSHAWTRTVDHAGDGVWFMGGGAGAISTPQVRRSVDDGRTWTVLSFPATLSSVAEVHFSDKDTGLVTDGDIIWRTTNGGDTWDIVLDLATEGLKGISFAGDDTWFVVQGDFWSPDGATVHKSTANGALGTWQSMSLNGIVRAPSTVLFSTPEHGFMTSGANSDSDPKGIFRTEDGGLTWAEEQSPTGDWEFAPIAVWDKNRIIAVGGPTGVGLTTSGGNGTPIIIVSNERGITESAIPSFDLDQNYPNPFSRMTTIDYSVRETADVMLAVYDLLGREVERLVDGTMPTGKHTVQFTPSGLASGMYIMRIQVGDVSTTKQIMYVR